MTIREQIGNKIQEIRKLRKMSQNDLSILMGLTRTSIVNIEKGRQGVTAENLWKFCTHLKMNPADVFPDSEWGKDLVTLSKIAELEDECKIWKERFISLKKTILTLQNLITD
jgi:transcriptional regulator with XRE-family HTH domain